MKEPRLWAKQRNRLRRKIRRGLVAVSGAYNFTQENAIDDTDLFCEAYWAGVRFPRSIEFVALESCELEFSDYAAAVGVGYQRIERLQTLRAAKRYRERERRAK